jgi:hypothetical protein
LEEERQALGEWWFKQEYLCEFVETVDQVFSHDQVMRAIDARIKPLSFGTSKSRNIKIIMEMLIYTE